MEKPMKPIVSIILTHHLPENRGYLDLCLKGALASEGIPIEILLGSSYDIQALPQDSRLRLLKEPGLDNATKKIHTAMNHLSPSSEYILLLSDDVYISRTLIKAQHHICKQADFILNPMSNGELGGHVISNTFLKHDTDPERTLTLRPDIMLEDLVGYEERAAHTQGPAQMLLPISPPDWVSFYCTMMSLKTWNKVGLLDPELDIRHNDQDYCYRARKLGIPSAINLDAFCIHFGSKTLPKCHSKEEMDKVSEYFCAKVGGQMVPK